MNNKVKCSNFNKGNRGGNDKPQYIFTEDEANCKYICISSVQTSARVLEGKKMSHNTYSLKMKPIVNIYDLLREIMSYFFSCNKPCKALVFSIWTVSHKPHKSKVCKQCGSIIICGDLPFIIEEQYILACYGKGVF